MLVPTTVLAEQHWRTFRERMSDFPIRIDLLSRFRKPAEIRKTVQGISDGSVDIVIGTHRLLSSDISYQNLGLAIVDEEQRFGVKHKEQFKERFHQIDLLTLSATPIPRTLYFSLMGVRDMSTIDTAPPNRIPVHTSICAYDERIIRDSVRRELERDGQVFFLHNRVQSIEMVKKRLQELVPEAKILIGHGQMAREDLEEVMHAFVDGRADVLLSTTIIESGIDIPNANTILIDRADRFGLADLYQLRGRVGRASRRAYAILMLPRDQVSTGDAKKRVSAIKQYTALGSGFKIAMRDLEIRGAGNLLGTRQSGHIAAVGFDLYCQLLRQSVEQLSGRKVRRRADVILRADFLAFSESRYEESNKEQLPAFIPATYVSDGKARLSAYRELASLADLDDLRRYEERLRDRFGRLPHPARNLIQVSRLRLEASAAGAEMVEIKGDRLMVQRNGGYLMLDDRHFPRLRSNNSNSMLREAVEWLESLNRP
jgi:transcription-repair coupling factor (superfamily II helicase)